MNKILKKISLIMLIAMQIIVFVSCGPKNGLIRENGHTFYYVNGEMQLGWQKINNKWYFFYQTDHDSTGEYIEKGSMKYDSWLKYGADYYHFDDKGMMQTGWQNIENNWYYLGDDGKMRTNSWVDNQYYVNNDGHMITDGWANDDNYSYYFGSDGKVDMTKSKQLNNSKSDEKINNNVDMEAVYQNVREALGKTFSGPMGATLNYIAVQCYDIEKRLEKETNSDYYQEAFYLKNIAESGLTTIQDAEYMLSDYERITGINMFRRYYRVANQYISKYYQGIYR